MSTLGEDDGVKLISTMNCHFISVEHSSKVFYYIFYEEKNFFRNFKVFRNQCSQVSLLMYIWIVSKFVIDFRIGFDKVIEGRKVDQ